MGGETRPDGSVMIGWGWVLIVVGALLLLIGLIVPTFSDSGYSGYLSERSPTLNPWKWPLIWLGIGLPNLGVIALLAGHIVRAIWFLPGRDDELPNGTSSQTVAVPHSPPQAEVPADDEVSEDEGLPPNALGWLVAAILVVAFIFFIVVTGGRSSNLAPATNVAAEQLNAQDPALDDYGDQTNRLRGSR